MIEFRLKQVDNGWVIELYQFHRATLADRKYKILPTRTRVCDGFISEAWNVALEMKQELENE